LAVDLERFDKMDDAEAREYLNSLTVPELEQLAIDIGAHISKNDTMRVELTNQGLIDSNINDSMKEIIKTNDNIMSKSNHYNVIKHMIEHEENRQGDLRRAGSITGNFPLIHMIDIGSQLINKTTDMEMDVSFIANAPYIQHIMGNNDIESIKEDNPALYRHLQIAKEYSGKPINELKNILLSLEEQLASHGYEMVQDNREFLSDGTTKNPDYKGWIMKGTGEEIPVEDYHYTGFGPLADWAWNIIKDLENYPTPVGTSTGGMKGAEMRAEGQHTEVEIQEAVRRQNLESYYHGRIGGGGAPLEGADLNFPIPY
jgi:hypothetical protein